MSHYEIRVNYSLLVVAPPTPGTYPYDIISDAQVKFIQDVFYRFLWPSLSLVGLVSNVVNITVFVKVGLHDSVTVSFFILSIVDVCYVVCSVTSAGLFIFAEALSSFARARGIYALAGYITTYGETFFNMSLGISTYIAVAKCCCVARPLTFKFAFTVRRTVAVLLLICLAVVITKIPRYTTFGMHWATNSYTNTTFLEMWTSPDYNEAETVHRLLNRTVYPNVVLGVVIICSLILAKTLADASKFRRGFRERNLEIDEKPNSPDPMVEDTEVIVSESATHDQDAVKPRPMFSTKDMQVIKAVMVVTGFLLVEALVVSIIALTAVFVPGFAPGGRFNNLHATIRFMEVIWTHVTATVNTVVYYNFNSNFRKLLLAIVGHCYNPNSLLLTEPQYM